MAKKETEIVDATVEEVTEPVDLTPNNDALLPTDTTPYSPEVLGDPIVGAQQTGLSASTFYTVVEGDTMESVAESFGLDVKDLRDFNNYGRANKLEAGMLVRLPLAPA